MKSKQDGTSRRSVLRTTGTALAVASGTALAADSATAKPTLTLDTHPASDVNTTYATLNGEIVFMGGDADSVTVWFEWGEEGNNFPNDTPEQTYYSATTFDDTIDGLDPGTTYEFRARGYNSIGYTDTGDTHTFTTPN
jgi:subtilisin